MRVELYRGWEELQPLRKAWNDLVDLHPRGSPCMTFEWLHSWWAAFGEGRRLLVVALFEGEALVALAPLAEARHRVAGLLNLRVVEMAGDGSGDSDHLDAPARPGCETLLAEQLLSILEGLRWDLCRLNLLPQESWIPGTLTPLLARRGWPRVSYRSPTCAATLPGSREAYLETLRPSDREHLLRYTRRLERRHHVDYQRCSGEDWLAQLFELHAQRWARRGARGIFADPRRQHFYRLLTPRLLESDRLELWRLCLDGRPVAMQYAMRHQDTVFQLQEGFDPACASDRVGTVLRGHVLGSLGERGITSYDYLGGYDAEKARWGARPGWYWRLHFARPLSLGHLYLVARRLLTRWQQRWKPPDLSCPDTVVE